MSAWIGLFNVLSGKRREEKERWEAMMNYEFTVDKFLDELAETEEQKQEILSNEKLFNAIKESVQNTSDFWECYKNCIVYPTHTNYKWFLFWDTASRIRNRHMPQWMIEKLHGGDMGRAYFARRGFLKFGMDI